MRERALSFVISLTVEETTDSGWSSIPNGRFEMKRAIPPGLLYLLQRSRVARTLPAAPSEQSDQIAHQPVGGAWSACRGHSWLRPGACGRCVVRHRWSPALERQHPRCSHITRFRRDGDRGRGNGDGPVRHCRRWRSGNCACRPRVDRRAPSVRTHRIDSLSRSRRSFDRRPTGSKSGTARRESSTSVV